METIKMNKVLIALDFDPSAQRVAEVGFSLTKNEGTEFTILHVISEPLKYKLHKHITIMGFAGHRDIVPLQLESIDGLKNVSRLFLEKTKHHLGDKFIQTLVMEGDISDSILKAAKDIPTDVIVMGYKNQKRIKNLSTMNATEKLFHHTSIPLLIIPIDDDNHDQ